MKTDDLPIIWIEWGRRIPKYLRNNIALHNEMFPNLSQYLLSDFGIEVFNSKRLVSQFRLEEIPKSKFLQRFDEISRDRSSIYSQKNFWIGTTRRFFLLHDFMEHSGLSAAMHVESDNILIDFKLLQDRVHKGSWSLAYPMQSDSLGCGSIFIVRNLDELRKFLEFILSNWANPLSNDMILLGSFANMSKFVEVLPSWPTGEIAFDPGAYGKYFLGSDARNFRIPTRCRGIVSADPTSLLNQMPKTSVDIDCDKPLQVVLNGKTKLMNLHVHSKVIPKNLSGLNRFIRRGISTKRGFFWQKGSLDMLVTLERILTRIFRFLRSNREIRFR